MYDTVDCILIVLHIVTTYICDFIVGTVSVKLFYTFFATNY
jgi:hypothetical protein